MKQFNQLVRDTERVEIPYGSWQNARNILKTKGFKSISNEHSNTFHALIPGVVIGIIETNTDLVYFVKGQLGDEIGRIKVDDEIPTYNKIVGSEFFNFQYAHPIEGVFLYNYLGELIVAFCDGIEETANTPKIVNIDNIGAEVDGNNNITNSDEFNKLELFPNIKEGDLIVETLDSGNLDGNIAYVTYAYVFEDTSTTSFFAINNIAYLSEGYDPLDKKGMRLTFNNLDVGFSKLVIGLIIKKDNNLIGYESYDINYSGTTKEVDITSLGNFTLSSPEAILLEKTVFRRIETITKNGSQAFVANYKVPKPLDLQKYFLDLELVPTKYLSTDNTPSFMPDEVYAFYIQVQFKNGVYSDAFHIPGREAIGSETAGLTGPEKSEYNLQWVDNIPNGNFKNFHIFNNGSVNSSGTIASFGYWENEETYPNNENFDSRTDYEGFPIAGGKDLRNTPIRYHRFPNIKNLASFDGGAYIADSNNTDSKTFYKLGIKVTNFFGILPPEIINQIQGYRISYVKRSFGNSYTTGNFAMTRRGSRDWIQAGVPGTFEYHDFNTNLTSDEAYFGNLDINFSKGRLISNELFKLRPTLDLTYLRTNYLFRIDAANQKDFPDNANLIGKVKDNIKYLLGNNIANNTQYHEEGINIDIDNDNYLRYTAADSPTSARYYVANVTAYSHKTNLYAGFKSNSLVIVGKTNSLTSVVSFKGGDTFNNNETDLVLHTAKSHRYTTAGGRTVVWRYGNYFKTKGFFSPINNTLITNNEVPVPLSVQTIGDNEKSYRIDIEFLNGQDYDFDVKGEDDLSSINDVVSILTFDVSSTFIDRFPFRIHRSLKIPKESLSTNSLRTYLSDDYYEMANDKGEITAIRADDRTLYIQHRFTLFVARVKDKLKTDNIDAYLGDSELFDRDPEEILRGEKGVIGSVSKFACKIIKGNYITINAVDGQIFMIKGNVNEISSNGNRNWFNENWDIGLIYYKLDENSNLKRRIDNPFCSMGYCIGYDEKYNRLLFTKRLFTLKNPELLNNGVLTFDGQFYYDADNDIIDFETSNLFTNESYTLSYGLDAEGEWICDHDYFPNYYYYTQNKHFSLKNFIGKTTKQCTVYRHNDLSSVGTFYGIKYKSYIDLAFTNTNNVSKILQAIQFRTTSNQNDSTFEEETISAIMIFTNHQCSNEIELGIDNIIKIDEGKYFFNDFRDLVINRALPIIYKNGSVNLSNLNLDKAWFDKNNFIDTFFIVRLIMNNVSENNVFLHEVNTVNIRS